MTAQEKPCKSTVVGRLDTFPLISRISHNTRNLRVWLPPKFDPSRNYPVLYVLDGASAFDTCTADRHEEMSADETLTSVISTRKIPPLIVVGIDNGSDAIGGADGGLSRAREFIPYPAPFHPRTLEPLGASFPSFIETDVMPAVAAKYPVLNGPDHAALWGASYGGVAVLYALINRPDLFSSGIVETPSLQVGSVHDSEAMSVSGSLAQNA